MLNCLVPLSNLLTLWESDVECITCPPSMVGKFLSLISCWAYLQLIVESMNKAVKANGGNKRDFCAVTSPILVEEKVQFRECFHVLLQISLWFWVSVCRSISCQNDAEIWSSDQSTLNQNWNAHMNIKRKKLTTSAWELDFLRHIRPPVSILLNVCMLYFPYIWLTLKYKMGQSIFITSPKSNGMPEQ